MGLAESDLRSVLDATRPLWDELRGERVLLTGASGFFGRWLVETFAYANRALDLDAQLVALSRTPAPVSRAAVTPLATDVRTLSPAQAPGTFAFVIHAATPASSREHARDPQGTFDTIVTGTRRVLDLAHAARTRRLLYVSSGAVYGPQPADVERVFETAAPIGAADVNAYASTAAYADGKRAAEALCCAAIGIDAIIARPFAFVGPAMPLDGPFAAGCFIRDAARGGPICIEGDGSPLRTYLYGADLATWLWTMLVRGRPSHPYNVGGHEIVSIAELARAVAHEANGVRVEIAKAPSPGQPERYVPSVARARDELGLSIAVPLPEAIRRTLTWARGF